MEIRLFQNKEFLFYHCKSFNIAGKKKEIWSIFGNKIPIEFIRLDNLPEDAVEIEPENDDHLPFWIWEYFKIKTEIITTGIRKDDDGSIYRILDITIDRSRKNEMELSYKKKDVYKVLLVMENYLEWDEIEFKIKEFDISIIEDKVQLVLELKNHSKITLLLTESGYNCCRATKIII